MVRLKKNKLVEIIWTFFKQGFDSHVFKLGVLYSKSVGVTGHLRVCLKAEKERERLNAEGRRRQFQDHTDIMNHVAYLNKIQSSARSSQHIFPLKKYSFLFV